MSIPDGSEYWWPDYVQMPKGEHHLRVDRGSNMKAACGWEPPSRLYRHLISCDPLGVHEFRGRKVKRFRHVGCRACREIIISRWGDRVLVKK